MKGLRVGFVPGVTLRRWRTVWAERLRGIPLEVIEVAGIDQRRVLDDGEVNMVFARLPIDTEGVHVIKLYDEQPVIWLAKEHPLSLLDELTSADLTDETVLTEPDRSSIDVVASEMGVLQVPMSIARTHSRRDLVYRPLTDGEPTTIALVWCTGAENPLIDEFIGIVRGRTASSSRTAAERGPSSQAEPAKQSKPKPAKATSRPNRSRTRGRRGR